MSTTRLHAVGLRSKYSTKNLIAQVGIPTYGRTHGNANRGIYSSVKAVLLSERAAVASIVEP